MNWLLILTVGFVAANIVWGFSRGLLRVVYSMLAWIVILVIVTLASPYVADWLTENTTIAKRIESGCKEKIHQVIMGEEDESGEPESAEKDSAGTEKQDIFFWDSVVDTSDLADGFLEESGAYDAMAQKMTAVTIKLISYILVLVFCLVLSFLLAKILDLIGSLPVIGELNHALGGVAGLLKGIFLVWLIFSFIKIGIATDTGAMLYEQIQTSPLLLWFFRNNPVLVIIKRIIK